MFAAGPAKITSTRFHVRGPPVGVGAERVAEVGDALLDVGAGVLRESLVGARAARTRRERSRAASWSPDGERTAQPVGRPGERRCLLDGAAEDGIDVAGAGRCMPGIFTNPPSGITPMPYSMPLCTRFTTAGGKPM